MSPIAALAAFIATASLVTVTPGLDTALVLRAAAVEGRRRGFGAALGVGVGCLVWGAAVALGLGALLQASGQAFRVVRWLGAAYLVWLAMGLLLRPRTRLIAVQASTPTGSAFRRGLTTNLLNPKVGVFYVSFLPQFVPHGVAFGPWCFLLAVVHVVLGLIWFSLLISATHQLGDWFERPGVVKALDRATGAVFLAFGLDLAFSKY